MEKLPALRVYSWTRKFQHSPIFLRLLLNPHCCKGWIDDKFSGWFGFSQIWHVCNKNIIWACYLILTPKHSLTLSLFLHISSLLESLLTQMVPFVSTRKRHPFLRTSYCHLLGKKCHTNYMYSLCLGWWQPLGTGSLSSAELYRLSSVHWAVNVLGMGWSLLQKAVIQMRQQRAVLTSFAFLKIFLSFELLLDLMRNCKNRTVSTCPLSRLLQGVLVS